MASESTEKVNAGADTEKELAERVEKILKMNCVADWNFGSGNLCNDIRHLLRAALLAEAGERAKLEAQLKHAYEDHGDECSCPICNRRDCTMVEAVHGWLVKFEEEAGCTVSGFQITNVRAEAEAARAQGLEAQLVPVREVFRRFDSLVHYWSKREMESPATHQDMAADVRDRLRQWDKVSEALSQLPKPKKQPEKP